MSMTKEAKKDAVEPEARRLRRELFTDEMLDQLMAATDERGLSLTGQGDCQAQQAEFLAVAFGIPELHKAQGACPGAAVCLQRGEAQHSEMLGLHVSPRQGRRLGRCRCLSPGGL